MNKIIRYTIHMGWFSWKWLNEKRTRNVHKQYPVECFVDATLFWYCTCYRKLICESNTLCAFSTTWLHLKHLWTILEQSSQVIVCAQGINIMHILFVWHLKHFSPSFSLWFSAWTSVINSIIYKLRKEAFNLVYVNNLLIVVNQHIMTILALIMQNALQNKTGKKVRVSVKGV